MESGRELSVFSTFTEHCFKSSILANCQFCLPHALKKPHYIVFKYQPPYVIVVFKYSLFVSQMGPLVNILHFDIAFFWHLP